MNSENPLSLLIVFCVFFSFQLSAQQKSPSKIVLQQMNRSLQWENPSASTANFFQQHKNDLGLSNRDEMLETYSRKMGSDQEHFKYKQFHQGVPIFGSAYHLHTKAGLVYATTGYYLPLIELNVQPSLSSAEAVEIAMQHMDAEIYSWEAEKFREQPRMNKKPAGELHIVASKFPEPSERYNLAYVVDLYSLEPLDKQQYFVDAHSGEMLFQLPQLHHISVPAQGITKYYGEQTITVDSLGPNNFLLRDLSRGEGVITWDENMEIWTDEDNFWDLTNADQDEVAIDGHYAASGFYDYLLERFNWNGLGNNGEALQTRIHGGAFVNAFWDGTFATFGDGDCNHGPLTTLEVVAHEFTHGLTDYTSDLIYTGESGAINESMSDIFGKALEFYEDPNGFDWLIGESFIETPYVESFRSMEDPNAREHPQFYKGEYWTDGGGVHTNSSIGNHWFYLLVEGKSGVNEIGEAYDVQGIGMDKAMEIVFQCQSSYLSANSTYPEYQEYAVMAATDLFGANSPEKAAVEEAWKAVGLPFAPEPNYFDLTITLNNTNTFPCGQNFYVPLEVLISNIGTVDYSPGSNASFQLDGGFTQSLDDVILAGQSVTYTIDDYLFLESDEIVILELSVFSTLDQNPLNDNDFVFFRVGTTDENDLKMDRFDVPQRNCWGDLDEVNIRIRNSCCTTIEPGATFSIRVTDPASSYSWEKEYTLERALGPNRSFFYVENINFPEDIFSYEVNLDFDADTHIANNSLEFIPDEVKVINDLYQTTIDDDSFESFDVDGFANKIYDLDGEVYFASSSYTINPFGSLCPEAPGSAATIFSPSSLSACIDFSDWGEPTVHFDLIQFRTDEDLDFPELQDFTTITTVSWEDAAGEEAQHIYGQSEGEIENHEIKLPEGFIGRLTFDFTSRIGDIDDDDFTDYDANLIDNISISGIMVSDQNPMPQNFEIFPNPSSGKYFISQESIPQEIGLYTIQGQELRNIPVLGKKQQLDFGDIPDGYYFLKIRYEKDKILTQPLVKLSR